MALMKYRSMTISQDDTNLADIITDLTKAGCSDLSTVTFTVETEGGTAWSGPTSILLATWLSPETPAERKTRLAAVRKHKAEIARREAAARQREDADIEAAYQALLARRAKEAQDA